MPLRNGTTIPQHGVRATTIVALAMTQIVIGIHAALNPDHLTEKFYIGVLFAVGNGLLVAAILLMVSRRHAVWGWLLGAAVMIGEFAGFIASRTIGLPHGYLEPWRGSTEDYLGLISLVCEVAFVLAAVVALNIQRRHRGFVVSTCTADGLEISFSGFRSVPAATDPGTAPRSQSLIGS